MKRKFIETTDGSTSIYLEEMGEHYHSKHGAIVESNHIFIKNGLLPKSGQEEILVFEVGMGTGLNVMTTLKAAKDHQLKINYHAIEAFPIQEEELEFINFSSLLEMDHGLFLKIHAASWENENLLQSNFKFTKFYCKLINLELHAEFFDVVYFDAFAPEKQEEMWTEEIFQKMFDALKPEGILVTYCVKGVIRRRLQAIGFRVEKLKGPEGGKREMCRAWKDE
ncbi:tRNA (5-methylaminomethyl-2-thiouridine)(34)-methyltransferase MnmD [Vicingaceae bacterium]|nr:tRNA (5-methylaminomethyl-2-thiouridine)(34)-methyltransferase MnmD [Vicingaceae bacterium]